MIRCERATNCSRRSSRLEVAFALLLGENGRRDVDTKRRGSPVKLRDDLGVVIVERGSKVVI